MLREELAQERSELVIVLDEQRPDHLLQGYIRRAGFTFRRGDPGDHSSGPPNPPCVPA